MKQFARLSAAVTSLFLSAGIASAATTTPGTAMNVSATVNAYCAINSVGAIGFTSFNPTAGDQTARSDISVNCTNTTQFDIGLSLGIGTNASLSTGRVMTNGSNTLTYQLYSDSAMSSVWGDTVNTNTVRLTGAGFGTGTTKTATVYAKIPSQPNAVPAAYTDTVTVTVTY
jgi:spore coat protein U-like protein